MDRAIRTAVFPVAGLGTRFLPATKANPKEMLPIVDKPLIQYAVEEAVAAGVNTLVFITGRNKRSIPDHFDKAYELENELEKKGKHKLLAMVRDIVPEGVSCVYIRQAESLGLGHAVACARPAVGDEPFAVLLADDLIHTAEDTAPVLSQMVEQYKRYQCSILGVMNVPASEVNRYGIVDGLPFAQRLSNVRGFIEKPDPAEAPSTLAAVGRYILTPRIFEAIDATGKGAGGEIQLTDAIHHLSRQEQVLAYEFQGRRFDCGDKLGYLKATVELGMQHDELGEDFRAYLLSLAEQHNLS